MEPHEHLGPVRAQCAGKRIVVQRMKADGQTLLSAQARPAAVPVMARARDPTRLVVGASFFSQQRRVPLHAHDGGTRQDRLASFTTAVPPWLVPLDSDFVRRANSSNNSDPSDFVSRLLEPTAAEPSKDSET